MIASDDNNPNFVGAHDPDSRLHVRFYKKQIQNNFETEKQGHPIFVECDFVAIHLPGDKTTSIDTFVNESHKERFPRQWAHYVNNNKEGEQLIGTPIAEWALISRTIAEELKYLGFKTVESIAGASDSQLQSLGMRAGMQPHAFRERAQRYLSQANREATSNADAAEKQALRDENEAAMRAIAELREQMATLQAAPERAKPGRKPREKEVA